MAQEPINHYVVTAHADVEMSRRGLTQEIVRQVLSAPEQRRPVRPGRDVLQSRILFGEVNRVYLVRVFVDVDRQPAEVVTVYRTSKISKYWSRPL